MLPFLCARGKISRVNLIKEVFFMEILKKFKSALSELTEVALLLLALGIVAGILTGSTVPFLGDIVGNIVTLVKALGDNGLVGLIALGIILWLFGKRN